MINTTQFSSTCETARTGNGQQTSIKEIQEQILSAREKFQMLKQRKRQHQNSSSGLLQGLTNGSTMSAADMGFAISQGTHRNLYQTQRSSSKQDTSSQNLKICLNRDMSIGSDNIDRDEESLSTIISLTRTQKITGQSQVRNSMKLKLQKVLKNSFKNKLKSYQFDGARLLVNRLQAQLKSRFDFFCDVLQGQYEEPEEEQQTKRNLPEKWRFVRNAMDNIDRTKKAPLQDKTNQILNNQNNMAPAVDKSNSFIQIQQMFENFKQMRNSSGENTFRSMKAQAQQQQENIHPHSSQNTYTLQNIKQKIPSKNKEGLKIQRRADLPPYYNQKKSQKNDFNPLKTNDHLSFQTGGTFDYCGDSFNSAYKENEYFIQYYPTKDGNENPTTLLTSRTIALEDDTPDGIQQLPLESPMNADKFIKRRQYLKEDSVMQQQVQAKLKIEKLSTLIKIKAKSELRSSFIGLKKRTKAHNLLKKLLSRKIQEEKLLLRVQSKQAFVRMIKNCIFMNKVEQFMNRAHQRLLEKGYDKLKENNWVIEERKETLEAIFIKYRIKHAFNQFYNNNRNANALFMLDKIYNKFQNLKAQSQAFKQWKQSSLSMKTKDTKSQKLQSIIEHHTYRKSGFEQFKRIISLENNIKFQRQQLQKIITKQKIKTCLILWKQFVEQQSHQEIKQQTISNLLHIRLSLQKQRSFTFWKTLTLTQNIQKSSNQSSALFLILKPILRSQDKQLKIKGFKAFKERQTLYEKVKKQMKIIMMINKTQRRDLMRDRLMKWKQNMNEQNVSYLEQSPQSMNSQIKKMPKMETYCSSPESSNNSQKENCLSNFNRIKVDLNDSPIQPTDQDDFDKLTQIDRISYETPALNTIIKRVNQGIQEEIEVMPPLQLTTKRQQSETFKKYNNTKIINLRYL